MANKIILKKSSVVSKVPTTSDLDFGELAVNYADGKLYYKKADGTTIDSFNAGNILSGAVFNDGYTEEVFAVSGTTPALSPTNGSIQTWTLTGNSTPTAGTWSSGQSMILLVNDSVSSYTIAWTSLPVTWFGGTTPDLAPAGGFTFIVLLKVGTTIYGVQAGQVV